MPEFPDMPDRIRVLPRDARGWPVPWFVAWMKDDKPVPRGEPGAEPDFRIIRPSAIEVAVKAKRCWVCGQPTGRFLCFVIGPMCSVNRITSEPPCHRECAVFAARACPFLTRPRMRRNDKGIEELKAMQDRGIHLDRNPGATCLWTVDKPFNGGGYSWLPAQGLFTLGEPVTAEWYAEGRPATRAEIEASIKGGLPFLREMCDSPEAHAELDRYIVRARRYLPAEVAA